MACTLFSLYRLEQQVGTRMPAPGRSTIRAVIWSLLVTFQPDLTILDVGGADPAEYRALMEAAASLVGAPEKAEKRPATPSGEPPGWLDTWATGRYDLGLGEEEFWQLSPAMFDALWARAAEADRKRFYGHGITASVLWNANVGEEGPFMEPDDFVPMTEERRKIREAEQLQQQRKALKGKLRAAAAALGARVKTAGKGSQ